MRTATSWFVTWHDHSSSWENYTTIQDCEQLTSYALTKPYLKHRFSQSGVAFNAWSLRVNKLSYDALIGQQEGYFPVADKTLKQPFALAIQFFDRNNELQDTKARPEEGVVTEHMLQSPHCSSFLTAYLVRTTPHHFEVYVPSLSEHKDFKKFPAKGAFYKSFTASEMLQFARSLPTEQSRENYCADTIISRTDFRKRVWPEQWDYSTPAQDRFRGSIAQAESDEQTEMDEGLTSGEHTGKTGIYKARGKVYHITLQDMFPNGDYLCLFEDDSEARVPLPRITFQQVRLLRRKSS